MADELILFVESDPPLFPGVAPALIEHGRSVRLLSDAFRKLPPAHALKQVTAVILNTTLLGVELESLLGRLRSTTRLLPTLALLRRAAHEPVVEEAEAYLYEPFTIEEVNRRLVHLSAIR